MHYIPKLYNNIILYRQHFTLEFVILKIDLVGKSQKINRFAIFACNIPKDIMILILSHFYKGRNYLIAKVLSIYI